MDFGFDLQKSLENKSKHGIDFEEAQKLWLDPNAVLGPADSRTENRFIFLGEIAGKIWAAIITFRESKIRTLILRQRKNSNNILKLLNSLSARRD